MQPSKVLAPSHPDLPWSIWLVVFFKKIYFSIYPMMQSDIQPFLRRVDVMRIHDYFRLTHCSRLVLWFATSISLNMEMSPKLVSREWVSFLRSFSIFVDRPVQHRQINLSGGQKARGINSFHLFTICDLYSWYAVSLARAVYSRASTLLLDDVLSARELIWFFFEQ